MMEGYARIAQLMARHDEFAMFRRFRVLNMQNLLHMQAELTFLEEQLKAIAYRDAAVSSRVFYSKDWWALSQSERADDKLQWEKCLDIRAKLKEYSRSRITKQSSVLPIGKFC